MTPELFRCVPLAVKLTRSSCASRHRAANNGGRTPGARPNAPLIYAHACRECPVGAAHARGELLETWPDGKPVELVQLGARAPAALPPTPPITRVHLPTPTRTDNEDHMPEPRMITHNGETLSMTDWAKRLGVSATAIRARIDRDWTEAEAVSTPQGGVPARLEAKRAKAQEQSPGRAAKAEPPPAKRTSSTKPKSASSSAARAPLVTSTDVAAVACALDPVELLTRLGYPSEYVGETPAGRLVLVRASAE